MAIDLHDRLAELELAVKHLWERLTALEPAPAPAPTPPTEDAEPELDDEVDWPAEPVLSPDPAPRRSRNA